MNFRYALNFAKVMRTGQPSGPYAMKQESDKILLYQASSGGVLSFPVVGSVTVDAVAEQSGWLVEGSSIVMVDDNSSKRVEYTFAISELGAEITAEVTYKTDQMVDETGIEADILSPLGIAKDQNIHVNGDAVLVEQAEGRLKIYIDKGSEQAHHVFEVDGSRTEYKNQQRTAATTRTACVKLLNNDVHPMRLLCQPNGCEATFTFTIHPDSESIDTLKTVVYGSNDDAHPDYMVKGLFGNGLVGTWGVFCDTQVSDPDMLALKLQMQADGFEIVPHSILDGNDNRQDAVTWLPVLDSHFNCRNWIDHSLASGARTLGMASLGWDPEAADYYIMDLLETYGYDYAWSYQDLATTTKNQIADNRYNFPAWLVYQNPHLVKPNDGALWLYKTSPYVMTHLLNHNNPSSVIDTWIKECGVVVDHDYYGHPSREGKTFVAGTPYTTTAKYNGICEYLGLKKRQGVIWNPTASQFYDYIVKLLSIDVAISGKNTYEITNNSGAVVNCSFLVGGYSGVPKLNSTPMDAKRVSRGTICWADIPVGVSEVTL